MLRYRWRALALLTRFLTHPDQRPGDARELVLADGSTAEALFYEPLCPPRATVLAIHGLTLRAAFDPRLVAVARALQGAGVRVICPRIAGLDRLAVEVQAAERIALVARAVLETPGLAVTGRQSPALGMFSASFAAGQSLIAASSEAIASRISGMLLVGGYLDSEALLTHVLGMENDDSYGRLVAIRGLLYPELTARLRAAIDAALRDESLRPEIPSLPAAMTALDVSEQARFTALLCDKGTGRTLAREIIERRPLYVERLSVLPRIHAIEASVTLIHGRKDKVIPASQSVRLALALQNQGNSVHLHISDLLDHGDLAHGVRNLFELPAIVDAVSFWLRSLEQK